MLLNRINFQTSRCAVKRQPVSFEYSKTHIKQIYISCSSVESYFCTFYTCLVLQQRHIQNLIKYLRWSFFAYPVNNFKVLTVCAKTLHLRCLKWFSVRLCSNCTSNVLRHHNKQLIRYLHFLHGLRIMCLLLNISEKLHWQMSSNNQERQRFITFTFVNTIQYSCTMKNNIYHSNKWGPPPFLHLDFNPVIVHTLVHSVDKIHVLDVTVDLIWLLFLNILSFNLVATPRKSLRVHKIHKKLFKPPCCCSN